jgi:3',5'-cyclic AMP phosphodiesterase CpdA
VVTLAHFSDVHALSLAGVSPLAFLNKRVFGGINLLVHRRNRYPVRHFEALVEDLNRVRPDHVAVTGDLTNLSLDAEFALARALLDRIALGPSGVTVIPGNHDVYVWAAKLRRTFERSLAPYASSDGADGEPRFPIVRERGAIALVGISTAVPSPVPFATGRVGHGQLDAVEEALGRLDGRRFRVVLIHHPPVRNRHVLWRGLRDRDRLAEVLARVGAELVLHGHEHRDLRSSVSGPRGPIPIVGVGSATYDDPRPERRARYNLIRIDGDRFTVETRVHDAATGRFVPLIPHPLDPDRAKPSEEPRLQGATKEDTESI